MANLTRSLVMPDGSAYEFFGKQYYGVYPNSTASNNTYNVNIDGFTMASLVAGVRVSIKFDYSDESGTGTSLNVSGTGAKSIRIASNAYNYMTSMGLWSAGQIVDFVFDGSSWVIHMPPQITLISRCITAIDTAEKTIVSLNGFSLRNRTMLAVCFTYGNTATNPTLNVNSTGAFPIVINEALSQYTRIGNFSAGYHLLMLEKTNLSGYTYVWKDLTYLPISNEMSSSSSITYASSKAVSLVNSVAQQKYKKPSGGIPASDIASGVIPTAVSALTNDAGYITLADLPVYDGGVS